jgi:hypothetical protein
LRSTGGGLRNVSDGLNWLLATTIKSHGLSWPNLGYSYSDTKATVVADIEQNQPGTFGERLAQTAR